MMTCKIRERYNIKISATLSQYTICKEFYLIEHFVHMYSASRVTFIMLWYNIFEFS